MAMIRNDNEAAAEAQRSAEDGALTPDIPPNGMTVLARRYLIRDEHNRVLESPVDLLRRVARFIAEGDLAYGKSPAEVDALAGQFYAMMARLEFLPNSPTLMNAGRPLGQLSACFVLPVADSMESIFETLKHTALIHQSGGGTGFNFSHLRPKGDVVRSTMGVSSGPVSFMEVYNAATEAIKQGGTRRGANMGILQIDHPDIEEFISAKDDLRKVTNFNISVTVTDAFMQAVAEDADFPLRHPNSEQVIKTVRARELFNRIIDSAWRTGEPGLVFIDRLNADNPTPALGRIESTNPCGEVPLLAYEACNLGSINLGRMLTADHRLDWDKLAETVTLATHFLDNVITQNRFPIPEIQRMVEANRKIGLGVMGWADCLLALGVPYNSEEAILLGREVMAWIDFHSKLASVELAKVRGAFPAFPESRYAIGHWLVKKHGARPTPRLTHKSWQQLSDTIQQHGLRNATTTCVAPTGTISIIAGASGGIEPVFALAFTRNVMDNTHMLEVHPRFLAWLEANGLNQSELLEQVAKQGSLSGLSQIPDEIRRLFVTSFDIEPVWHVRMQAAFQEFTDNGVSKTINFPQDATREAIAETYQLAFQSGIKGITVYRNNSRLDQPMSLETRLPASASEPSAAQEEDELTDLESVQRPIRCIECD
jgi:ribonucleoside-diphosphate reductase alpha chain